MPPDPADLDLIRRDPGLPGLALALDTGALAARLGCGSLMPHYLRYKPGESCTARLEDGNAGLILRAVTRRRFDIYRRRASWRHPGSPVRFLDDLCVVILPGTFDRGLKGAKRLLAPDLADRLLAELTGLEGNRLTLLRHKPGRRIVARIDRQGQPVALLKAVPRGRFAALLASAEMAASQGGAPLLATDPARGIAVQGWIDGVAADRAPTQAAFAATGAALARLHALPAPSGRAKSHPCGPALTALARLLPALAPEARALAGALNAALMRDGGGTGFCHGDFSADQVVMTPDGPRFIDWDRAGPGPVQTDLGSFLARLDADRIMGGADAKDRPDLKDAFLAGYQTVAGLPDAVPLFHAAALAALVCEPFRQRQPGWPDNAARLLRRAADLAGRDAALARALDRDRMERAIRAAGGTGIRLSQPELLRDRPGRRALIAYRGQTDTGPFEAYGKLRVKGPDRRTPALHNHLRAAGLTGDTAVPRVLGLLPEAGLWLQERVHGQVLGDLLRPGADPAPAAAAGRALARLHLTRPPADNLRRPHWTLEAEVAVMRDALTRAALAHPHLRGTLARLADDLGAQTLGLAPVAATPIHRDYYPDQVIIAPDRTWLLDLDLYTTGDPAIDVANFIAHLRETELRLWKGAGRLKAQEEAFLQGYTQLAPVPGPARLDILTRVSLARHIWVATRIPKRSHVITLLLDSLMPISAPRQH